MTVVEEKIAALDRGLDVEGDVFKGWEEIRGWFADYLDTMEQPRWTDRHYEPIGESAFMMLARFEMSGAASGVALDTELGQVYEIQDGLFRRGPSHTSHAEACAAAERLKAGARLDA